MKPEQIINKIDKILDSITENLEHHNPSFTIGYTIADLNQLKDELKKETLEGQIEDYINWCKSVVRNPLDSHSLELYIRERSRYEE